MTIYADTSFFVSAYLRDQHTPEVLRRLAAHPRLWLTPFHQLEFAHAVAQNVYHRRIPTATANAVHREFASDCTDSIWDLVDLPPAAFETGAALARRHVGSLGTRTLDTLHVACALELRADRFWTFDDRQRKLARAVGLRSP